MPGTLGARYSADKSTVTFSVGSLAATRIEVWMYAVPAGAGPVMTTAMTGANGVFSASVTVKDLTTAGLTTAIYYGYRAWGPNWAYDPGWKPGAIAGFAADVDRDGNRFNPNKLLLDPYALEVSHCPQTPSAPDRAQFDSGTLSRLVDTGPTAPKGIVIDVSANFGAKPTRAFKDEIIYEVHVRGLTKNDPGVPAAQQGTYLGAAGRAAYLQSLGVTAVEFLPLHETQNALNDLPQYADAHNYWGYDSCSYFAPDRRYASDQTPGGPTREVIAMVKAFHDAGLKVYVDVVYNHHDEGDVDPQTGTLGVIYTLRGLDNASYYEDLGDQNRPNLYENDNGVGPNLNAATLPVRNLVVDSLRYWSEVIGVDGFRFDLAAILGNSVADGGYAFDGSDPNNILNRAVSELPARPAAGGAGVDLIAEPYTADGNGQEQGHFPVGWAEWNDRFRDTFRASQNKLGVVGISPGAMATRFAGSSDFFEANGRGPWSSVNYIVCHDGFTLNDLHTRNDKSNEQPYPYGPSDGGRSASDEMCWDHGGDPVAQEQAQRTSLALLLLSAGVPMLLGGSERGRTQYGNNNAYNLDTVASWFDWTPSAAATALTTFTSGLCALRNAHPALRPSGFFTGTAGTGGLKDITWLRDDGAEVDAAYFADVNNHFLAYRIAGTAGADTARSIYVAYNGWIAPIGATLPPTSLGWWLAVDTDAEAGAFGNVHRAGAETKVTGPAVTVSARSVQVFMER